MLGTVRRSFDQPDSREEFPLGWVELIRVGSLTLGRETLQPGWRWSVHVRPTAETERCEYHHVGVCISGRWVAEDRDGTQTEFGPGDAYDVAPGHDAWVVGDEPSVVVDFQGIAGWGAAPDPAARVLTTVLFTDIADSTAVAEAMGDRRWKVLLAQHLEDVGHLLAAGQGRLVKTTGDGLLATFDQPAAAVRSAAAVVAAGARLELRVRAGVHTGEVELADDDLRGVGVHMAARVMAAADGGEVLVSATTRELVAGSGLELIEKGSYELKGISGPRTLYALRT